MSFKIRDVRLPISPLCSLAVIDHSCDILVRKPVRFNPFWFVVAIATSKYGGGSKEWWTAYVSEIVFSPGIPLNNGEFQHVT